MRAVFVAGFCAALLGCVSLGDGASDEASVNHSGANEPISAETSAPAGPEFLGLRSLIFYVEDLAAARDWYSEALGVAPYFDEPYYVGFRVGRSEIGLDPDVSALRPGAGGAAALIGVSDIERTFERLLDLGADPVTGVQEVGGDVRLVMLRDPFGNVFGIIEDPSHYASDEPDT